MNDRLYLKYTLAQDLGMTVRRLEREMPEPEFQKWVGWYEARAYYQEKANRGR